MLAKKLHKILLLITSCGILNGCGQMGPLYKPGTQSRYGPPHYSPLHPANQEEAIEEKNKLKKTKKEAEPNAQQTSGTNSNTPSGSPS